MSTSGAELESAPNRGRRPPGESPEPEADIDVLVVGGGPTGLAAALASARRGRSVRLLEASDRLGGMATGLTVAGQRVDLGSHRLHPSAPPRVRALIEELLGPDLQWRERNGRIRLGDRWVAFPLRPVDLVTSVPSGFALAAARDVATGPLRRPHTDSYAEVVRAGLGSTALRHFHGPMAAKLWGRDPDTLSGELARKRVPVRTGRDVVAKVVAATRRHNRRFLYPRLGYGQITDALAAEADHAGAKLEIGSRVEHLRPGSDRVEVVWTTRGPRRRIRAGRVLWTAAPEALIDVLAPQMAPPPPPPVEHRGLVLVYLAVAGRPYTDYDAHYVPNCDVAFSRLSEPANYRDGPDPDSLTVLCAEIPCTPGDELWRADIDTLRRLVLDGLARLELPPPSVQTIEVRRLPKVYPVLTVDQTEDRRRWLDAVAAVDGVTVVGRQGRLVADNLHHVLDMGLSAVDCLGDDGTWDHRAWARAEARFESFTVED
jgi:protoporphyrinogen oxidase